MDIGKIVKMTPQDMATAVKKMPPLDTKNMLAIFNAVSRGLPEFDSLEFRHQPIVGDPLALEGTFTASYGEEIVFKIKMVIQGGGIYSIYIKQFV